MGRYEDETPVRSVTDRKARAEKLARLYAKEQDRVLNPASAHGKSIAKSFWGRAWCRNIEAYQDYESRLPAGRSYLKNGAVVDLQIEPGIVRAAVAGEELYELNIQIDPIDPERLKELRYHCAGRISSLADLVAGTLSEELLSEFCKLEYGVFPAPGEIHFSCNCLDWADLCKHGAAVLYGVGARLDDSPELFFVLRGIEPACFFDMPSASVEVPDLDSGALEDIFGIKLD